MAAEARNNGSANLKEPYAAERLVEAATASSRCLVACKRARARSTKTADDKLAATTKSLEQKKLM